MRAQAHMKKLKNIQRLAEPWETLERDNNDALEMAEMMKADARDEAMEADLEAQATRMEETIDSLELKSMLNDPDAANNAYLIVHAGAGGTESCDWASMLMRMYTRWAERSGFKVSLTDLQEGDVAGITRATLLITGEYAFGYLSAENGVHRLVRISPFDSAKRRHTSFASVYAYPDIDDSIHVEINEKDLRIDTYRAGGKGGQHVNVTDSAVRLTHLPTNIVTQCQNERSQGQNKEMAMKQLRARLYQHYKEIQDAEAAIKAGEKKEIGWGSQIRSYVFQPYQMVKDLRTNAETSNISEVMDGDIDLFIESYLRSQMGKHNVE